MSLNLVRRLTCRFFALTLLTHVCSSHSFAALLAKEYQFLAKLDKLPAGAKLENLIKALQYDGLAQVLAQAKKYHLRTFDYQD